MDPIRSIVELPFRRRPALELLNLHRGRRRPDADYTGFGYSSVEAVGLERVGTREIAVVRDALVCALHSTELLPGESAATDDVELEFFVDEVAPGYSVRAPLSAFLLRWLPAVLREERAVVLALCNPAHAVVARPASLAAGVSLWYALGDVESWLEPAAADGPPLRLAATAWRTAS